MLCTAQVSTYFVTVYFYKHYVPRSRKVLMRRGQTNHPLVFTALALGCSLQS